MQSFRHMTQKIILLRQYWYYLQCIALMTSKNITPNEYVFVDDFMPDLLGLYP